VPIEHTPAPTTVLNRDPHNFNELLTNTMYEKHYISDTDNTRVCAVKPTPYPPKFLYTGEYCEYGVNPYNNTCYPQGGKNSFNDFEL